MPETPNPHRSELQARDHAVVWHPCAQMHDYEAFPPLEIQSARGATITLQNQHVVLDAISSWWCKSLGHAHPNLTAALCEQAERFEHVITANTTSELLVSLCERLLHAANTNTFTPREHDRPPRPHHHFTKCFFADNGSTGVEVALKMALQAQAQNDQPIRTKLAALANGYHGETAAAMSVSDLDLYLSPHGSIMTPVLKLGPVPHRTGPEDPKWQDASDAWPAIEQQLESQANTLAAIIYEPILQAAGGMQPYSPDLLRRLRQWADAYGVYLIADEIAAGLGRCGTVLASQLACPTHPDKFCASCGGSRETCQGPLPDFAVVSKGLTAGYLPMSVVLTTQPVYDLFYGPYHDGKAFMHSNTYAGSALAAAVAHAALDQYAHDQTLQRVATAGPALRQRLADLANSRPYLQNLRGVGMTAAIDLRQPDGTALDPKQRTGYAVYQAAGRSTAGQLADGQRCGALLRCLGDAMYLFPPLNCTDTELNAMTDVLADALDTVLGHA